MPGKAWIGCAEVPGAPSAMRGSGTAVAAPGAPMYALAGCGPYTLGRGHLPCACACAWNTYPASEYPGPGAPRRYALGTALSDIAGYT